MQAILLASLCDAACWRKGTRLVKVNTEAHGRVLHGFGEKGKFSIINRISQQPPCASNTSAPGEKLVQQLHVHRCDGRDIESKRIGCGGGGQEPREAQAMQASKCRDKLGGTLYANVLLGSDQVTRVSLGSQNQHR